MHPLLSDIKTLVFDTLFPIHCLGCNQEGLFLCLKCQKKLQQVKHQQCIICKMPSINGLTHQSCRRSVYPKGLLSIFDYRDPLVAESIISGKYKFLPDLYIILGALMADSLKQNNYHKLFTNAVLCPIPLSKQRLRWRGFNQSEILCQELSKHLRWPIVNLLERIKNTKTQKDLSKRERLSNVASSFQVTKNSHQQNSVIIVDDVVTTGITLMEVTKTLKSNNFDNIWCLTSARD